MKGKAVDSGPFITSSAIPSLPLWPQFFTQPPPASDLSTTDLKTVLLSRLLEDSDYLTSEAIDLISMLRHLTETPPPFQTPDSAAFLATIAEKDAQIAARDETIRLLQERVAALEKTCCAQSQGTKRRHDDQEDHDGHEGEKRRRIQS